MTEIENNKSSNDKSAKVQRFAAELGNILRGRRESLGLSMQEVARQISDVGDPISGAALGTYERGERTLLMMRLVAWCYVLDLDVGRVVTAASQIAGLGPRYVRRPIPAGGAIVSLRALQVTSAPWLAPARAWAVTQTRCDSESDRVTVDASTIEHLARLCKVPSFYLQQKFADMIYDHERGMA